MVAHARLSVCPRRGGHAESLDDGEGEGPPVVLRGRGRPNPLDAFASKSLEGDLGETPMDPRNTVGEIQALRTLVIATERAEASRVAKVKRHQSLRGVRDNGGNQLVGRRQRRSDRNLI